MRKLLICMVLCSLAGIAQAQTNLNTCLEYMTTNAPNSSWVLQDDGQGVYIKTWVSSVAKPTIEEAYAVWPQASVWKKDKEDATDVEYNNWTKREKAMIKLLVKEINILRVAAGLPARTEAQVKAALKAEM